MENKQLLDAQGKPLTKERIEEVFQNIFIDGEPLVQKCEWEEGGELLHTWKIKCGDRVVYTNDEGYQQFNDAIKRDFENYINDNIDGE